MSKRVVIEISDGEDGVTMRMTSYDGDRELTEEDNDPDSMSLALGDLCIRFLEDVVAAIHEACGEKYEKRITPALLAEILKGEFHEEG